MAPRSRAGTATLDALGAGVAVLTLIGEFHHRETRDLVRQLTAGLDGSHEHLVVDMRGVSVFGAMGLRALVKASLRAHERGIGFALVRPDREVWRPFELTFLDEQLPNAASLEEAVAALQGVSDRTTLRMPAPSTGPPIRATICPCRSRRRISPPRASARTAGRRCLRTPTSAPPAGGT